MKNERGVFEIPEILGSGPGHFGESPEMPEELEKSKVFKEKREGGIRNPERPGVRAGTFRRNVRKTRKA